MEHWEDGTPNPDGKTIRSKAKGLVLGIMYGMGAKLMSSILKVSVNECLEILDEFYKMFPTIKRYTEHNEEFAKEHGYVEDYIGRRRHLPDIQLEQVDIKAYKHPEVNIDYFDDITQTDLINFTIPDEKATEYWKNEYKKFMGDRYNYNKKAEFKEKAKAYNSR